MQKPTKIIITIFTVTVLLAFASYKLNWFEAGMKVPKSDANAGVKSVNEQKHFSTNATVEEPIEVSEIDFPKIGNSSNDFVIEPYEISMETSGLLNTDKLKDMALVLKNKTDSTDLRPTLVLLKQSQGGYQLYATSRYAIGQEYINGDKQYYGENISIDSLRNLVIETFNSGAIGNRETQYCFVNNQLLLTAMKTYNMGAGGHTGITIDVLNRKVTINETNTMKEDMPITTTYQKLPEHKPYLFETTDPTSVF